jgi:hypothetical protein
VSDLSVFADMLGEPRTSLAALADTLSEMAAYVVSVAASEPSEAEAFLLEATMASADAFPIGTRESERLGFIIAEVIALTKAGGAS